MNSKIKAEMNLADNNGYKVLLINLPHIQRKGLYPRVVFEPIGLAYIGAVLEKEGYNVHILDAIGSGFDKFTDIDDDRQLVGLSYEEIDNYVRKISPQVVGIGIPFSMRAKGAFSVASGVKQINKNIITILGGIHATSSPLECIQHPDVDYIVTGEGEVPMLKLIKTIKKGNPKELEEIGGIGYKKEGISIINPREIPIENLDELPFPARHLLPMGRYFEASKAFMTGRHGKRFACVITSRGCPFQCTFCVSHVLMGRRWRYRSPENVVDEIEMLVKKYGIDFIHFEDDNMTLRKDRIIRICDLLIERKLKIKWDTPNGVRADTLDEEVLLKMKASGCQHICVAPESGNQYVVNNIIKKRMDLNKVEEAVRLCKKIGIKVDAFFVIGSVGETKKQIEDTIKFAKKLRKLGVSRCHFHIATPFEGTELYEEAKKNVCLVEPPQGCIQLETLRIATPEFTVEDIDRYLIEGSKVNPIIPTDKIGLIFYLLFNNPVKLAKTSINYIIKRIGGLSS